MQRRQFLLTSHLRGSDTVVHDRALLASTLMHRNPKVGFLWAGAMISGLHTGLLERARYGSFDSDLLAAAWTSTIHSFMQLPVSLAVSGRIERDDECRLAYFACPQYHSNIPMSPWKPFGTTAVRDAELEVQIHANCNGHGLQYMSWAWDCWKDERPVDVIYQPPVVSSAAAVAPRPSHIEDPMLATEVPYDKMCLEDDIASSNATLHIFMWLRRGGFPATEQHIRRHEWLCEVFDDEEEEAYES